MPSKLIHPARALRGSLRLPGDKSISHRYAMLAGLAHGVSRLHNFSSGADPQSTVACMAALGARVEKEGQDTIVITGTKGTFQEPAKALDCGNSGSTMRMLSGMLAAQPHSFELVGDASLSRRPMERIRGPIQQFFAGNPECSISLTDGHAPIHIRGGRLHGIAFSSPIPSAQVKTAVLFAGLQAQGTTTLTESVLTRNHTEHALAAFGATVTRSNRELRIEGGQTLHSIDTTVPGDMSSAAFFLCAALLFADSQLVLDGVGMNPTRAALLDVVAALGARIKVLNLEEHLGELVGTIQVNRENGPRSHNQPLEISGSLAAQLIDEIPVLAAIAPFTEHGLRVRDAKELRIKESDRIALVVRNLQAMGAHLTEWEDGFDIPGRQRLHGAPIETDLDHRIAMAFAVAALRAEGDTLIHGAEVASVSFPEFFASLEQMAVR